MYLFSSSNLKLDQNVLLNKGALKALPGGREEEQNLNHFSEVKGRRLQRGPAGELGLLVWASKTSLYGALCAKSRSI